jgi:hypothetical protein
MCLSISHSLSLIHRHKIDFSYFLLFSYVSTRVHLARMKATQTTSIIWPVSGILQYEKDYDDDQSSIIFQFRQPLYTHIQNYCSHQSVSDEDVDLITSFVLGRTFFTYNDVLPSFLAFSLSLSPYTSSPSSSSFFLKHERNE